MSCWKTLGSPSLSRSPTTLKTFDGKKYTPYGILSNLQIELGGKTITIDVEVVGLLDNNILLGRPWLYVMVAVVSTYFRTIAFPFKGGITVIDQLAFFANSSQATGSIPLIHGNPLSLQSVKLGLLKDPFLMGTFTLPSPSGLAEVARVETCNMISSTSSDFTKISNYFETDGHSEALSLSPIESSQKAIFRACAANPNLHSTIVWVDLSLEYGTSLDPFSRIHSTDEGIIQSMIIGEMPWEDYHPRSYLLDDNEDYSNELNRPSIVDFLSNSVNTIDSKCNLSNIEETISMNILTKPNIVENIHVVKSYSALELDNYCALFREFRDIFVWFYEEMLDIDLSIVEHEIKMYPDVKPVRQRL